MGKAWDGAVARISPYWKAAVRRKNLINDCSRLNSGHCWGNTPKAGLAEKQSLVLTDGKDRFWPIVDALNFRGKLSIPSARIYHLVRAILYGGLLTQAPFRFSSMQNFQPTILRTNPRFAQLAQYVGVIFLGFRYFVKKDIFDQLVKRCVNSNCLNDQW